MPASTACRLAADTLAGYGEYLRRPDADRDRARRNLTELAGILTAAGLPDLAQRALDEVGSA